MARQPSPSGGPGPEFVRPLVDFLRTEAAGGVALVVATAVALVWANSPWDAAYDDLWHTRLAISLGGHELDLDLRHWINDGLMTVFFFVVGLEIKRELAEGELREPRKAALPAIAAVGGMVVPALIFLALNAGRPAADGWGIPMATDIAMAVGVLSLLGGRVPASLKLFVLALAIVDDIGAILVIALFYGDAVHLDALAVAGLLVAATLVMRWAGVRSFAAYVAAGVVLWLAVHESGVHTTLVGVVLGLLAPTRPMRQPDLIDADALADVSSYEAARETVALARDSVSVVEWLEHRLHGWSSFAVVPLFALANAGVPISGDAVGAAFTSRLGAGIVVGLVVGKPVGITACTWLAVRLRWGVLPDGAAWRGIVAVSALAGIGFTVSVFVAGLAFDGAPARQDEAKV
ncbi:MAG TPA: Na+/H+ antiporter NhaA, partial [Acidimicrobiales bacterium]|nr:Na+/H+ antiporter NhaA [Acidimicrobiales bacterium]